MTDEAASSETLCPTCGSKVEQGETAHGMCASCAWSVLDDAENESSTGSLMDIPGLRVVGVIAHGGMGVVYRAIEAEAARDVALKMMQPALAHTSEVRDRFAQEARAMGVLDHPCILPVYRVGEYHGLPYFTMKLAEGGALAQRLTTFSNDWRGIATLMADIAEAVHHAHQRGLLHRDLKPGNILFDAAGRAYVSDFGLVKLTGEDSSLTRSVSVLGTPHYMAPEVAERNARDSSVASDIWSLGAILYELIAQRLAFQAEGVPSLLRKIVDEEPTPLPAATPRDLATITLKCLQKAPHQRYASAGNLAEDLRLWLRGEPVTARRVGALELLIRWCRRRPALAAMSGLLIGSVIGSTVLLLRKNTELKQTLRTALFNEAEATRLATRVQSRDAALEAVHKAAKLGSYPNLEEEAASLLALPSVKLLQKINTGQDWASFSPDQNLINAADFRQEDGVRIVELSSGRELAKLPPGRAYRGVRECFSEDGRFLNYRHATKSRLLCCEWRTGRIVREFESEALWSAHFSPDSKMLVYGKSDGSIECYDLIHTDAPPLILPARENAPARPVAFSPDGNWLAVLGKENLISVVDAKTGAALRVFGSATDGSVLFGSWTGESQSMLLSTTNGVVRSWSMTGGPSRLLLGHSAQVYGVAVHPLGQIAVSSGFEGRSTIFDWPSGHLLGVEAGLSYLTRFSRDGQRLALKDDTLGVLKIFRVTSPTVCRQFASPDVIGGKALSKGSWCAQVQPGGRLLAASNYGSTEIYETTTSHFLASLPEGDGRTLAWTHDGSELWISSENGLVRRSFEDQADGSIITKRIGVIDLKGRTGTRLALAEKAGRWAVTVDDGIFTGRMDESATTFIPAPPEMPAHTALNPLVISPDGRWAIASAELEDKLGILDLVEGRWVKTMNFERTSYGVFRPDSQSCWIGSFSQLWQLDMRTLEIVRKIADREEPGGLGFIDASADGRVLATLDSGSIVLRHGDSGIPFLRLRHPLPHPAAWMSLTPDGRYLTFSGMDHVLQVWDLANLEHEFHSLELEWRGSKSANAFEPKPLTFLKVE